MIEIKIESQAVMSALGRLAQAGQNMSPLMRSISTELLSQTEVNFAAEGRPKWLGISRATLEKRVMSRTKNKDGAEKKGAIRKDGRISKSIGRNIGGMILQDTGQLAASISPSSDATSATVGSNKVYAAIHQIGGKAGRGHKATIPARPFLPVDAHGNLQPEAEDSILGIANNYLANLI